MSETLKIRVSRHSAFYSPLIAVIAGGFLEQEGLTGEYSVLQPGQRSRHLLAAGEVDLMQSAVGSNFGPWAAGETGLPVHFAQINTRDGFFLASREPLDSFDWRMLEGRSLVADHGGQPMLMLRYAAGLRGVDWKRLQVIDAGSPDAMDAAFRRGEGDFIHQQGPAPQQLEADGVAHVVASVGEAMPEVAFSSVCAMPGFVASDRGRAFTHAYLRARAWAQQTEPAEVARAQAVFFPGTSGDALTAAVARYQKLGCWTGDIAIPPTLFEQAVEVFRAGGAVAGEPPFSEIVVEPPA